MYIFESTHPDSNVAVRINLIVIFHHNNATYASSLNFNNLSTCLLNPSGSSLFALQARLFYDPAGVMTQISAISSKPETIVALAAVIFDAIFF
jgi:hypothetical protein